MMCVFKQVENLVNNQAIAANSSNLYDLEAVIPNQINFF